jgi:hypothetical protein
MGINFNPDPERSQQAPVLKNQTGAAPRARGCEAHALQQNPVLNFSLKSLVKSA